MRSTAKRILIIRLSAIGDVVVTTPVSRALREALPDAYLAWVVEGRAREILEGNPYLDEVIVWDRPKGTLAPKDMWKLHRLLKPHRFDTVIDCQGNLRSALAARLSQAKTIIGNENAKEHADMLYNVRVPRSQADTSSRQRCLDLLRPLGVSSTDRRMVISLSDAERVAAVEVLRGAGVESGEPYACLVPATTWAQKHWFEDAWAGLTDLLRERLGLRPVLMGGPADLPMMERIQKQARVECAIAAGRTSLRTAAAILEGARATVAVDTALMHASVAVGTPTVGVCGASYWPGFQDYERFVLVREEMACSPCLHRPTCEGRFDCMRALTPMRVFDAVNSLLGSLVSVLV